MSAENTAGAQTVNAARSMTMAAAILSTLEARMEADPRVMVLGEAVGRLGGVFGTSAGLLQRFGTERVVDTPLSEGGLVGLALGLALAGKRPVVELVGPLDAALEQITAELATVRERSGGEFSAPVVIRVPVGALPGAAALPDPSGLLQQVPGLQLLCPSSARSAADALELALDSSGPSVILEPVALYPQRSAMARGDNAPGAARSLRDGEHLTLLTWGAGVQPALQAADSSPHSVQVIDLQTLSPLDSELIGRAIKATGRVVVVAERSAAQPVLQQATQAAFLYLESPPASAPADVQRISRAISDSVQY